MPGKENNNLHQLAIALSDKILRVPSIYIFDERENCGKSVFLSGTGGRGI